MCIAIPGEIVSIDGAYGVADIMGLKSEIYLGLLESPRKGDLILIHAGCAIKKIDERYHYYLEDVFSHLLEGDY